MPSCLRPLFAACLVGALLLNGFATALTVDAVHAPPAAAPAVLAGQASLQGQSADPIPLRRSQAAAPDAFSADLAFAHIQKLAGEIGIREAGTANDQRAAEYIAETLRGYGYDVDSQIFPFTIFRDLGSSLEIGDGELVTAKALGYAPSGEATGELVYVGLGKPEEYPAAGVRGKIVLVERGELTFQAKVDNAERAGAAGIVVYNNESGMIGGTPVANPTVPALFISGADGQQLRARLASQQVTAHVTTRTQLEERTSANVVARLPGATGPRVVVGGHRDSVPDGPGANDNASGTATVLEIARVVAQTRPPLDYQFVAFGAEEVGLVGSRYFVQHLSEEERGAIVGMVNVDMAGAGEQLTISGTDALVSDGVRLAGQLGTEAVRAGSGVSGGSDHASFIAAKIPAVSLTWWPDANYHTAKDRPETIHLDQLQLTGNLALALVRAMTSRAVGG